MMMNSPPTSLPEQMDDCYIERPKGMKYPRRGACVLTTMYQSANIVAYEDYREAEDHTFSSFPSIPAYPPPSSPCIVTCFKRAVSQEDEASGDEGGRDIKRRGSVDR